MTDAGWMSAYGVALLLSAAALIRDRLDPERRRASLAAFVWTLSSILRAYYARDSFGLALALLDVALVLFLIGLAWKARHGWPVLAALVQSVGAAALIAGLTDSRLDPTLPTLVSSTMTHLTAAVLLGGAWLSAPLRRVQGGAHQLDILRPASGRVRNSLPKAPDRTRPSGVVLATADHVDVKLGHDVAERADVEFLDGPALRRSETAHLGHGERDFSQEKAAVDIVEFVEFAEACTAREQNQPRPAVIVLQPHMAERQVRDERRRRFDPGVRGPAHPLRGTAAQ